jgi:hypothetical protein
MPPAPASNGCSQPKMGRAYPQLPATSDPMEDQIPAVRGYKYVKLQDKVLLVLPESRVVVGELAR